MSPFWSGWIIFLIVLNLGIALFLFVWSQRVEIPTQPDGTTGHTWAHGVLREGVRRLPLWWVIVSASAFVIVIVYLVLYPGFGGFAGLLRWTSAGEYERAVAENAARLDEVLGAASEMRIDDVPSGHPVARLGRQLFLDNCAACHGTDASGRTAVGAPNLVDSKWLYGGDPDTVVASILDGRRGTMPPWGDALGRDGLIQVTTYVLGLKVPGAADTASEGKTRFEQTCAACHGRDGKGMPVLGAPDLTDDDWLYGGDFASVLASIRDGRSGEMPAWRGRLTEQEARAIAAWLYAIGEKKPLGHRARGETVAAGPAEGTAF